MAKPVVGMPQMWLSRRKQKVRYTFLLSRDFHSDIEVEYQLFFSPHTQSLCSHGDIDQQRNPMTIFLVGHGSTLGPHIVTAAVSF